MDLSNYLLMKHELSLVVLFLVLIIYDLFASDKAKKYYYPVACTLFLIHTVICFFFKDSGESFGGMYVTGGAYLTIKNILNIGLFLILLQAKSWLSQPESIVKKGEFFMISVLTLLGMNLMISSGHFLLFYLGLEMASLPMAALVAFNKFKEESVEAGAKYIFNAIFSSAVMIFGISFLYGAAGSLYYAEIATHIYSTPLVIMAMIFTLAGLFFKISLVPFHLWAPDTYQGAPTNVTLYLSTISKGAGVFALMVILYRVFSPLALTIVWKEVIWILILISITVANLFALRQKNIKRFLAFSSISQAGYIMLSVFTGTAQGMAASIFYILVYIFSNAAVFGVVSSIEDKTGKVNIKDYDGLYSTNPKLALVMMIALFSLGGIPPTAGFFSKLIVFMSAMQQHQVILVFLALLNTVISLYYYLLVVKAMFINKSDSPIQPLKTCGYMKVSLILTMIGVILIGLISWFHSYISIGTFGL